MFSPMCAKVSRVTKVSLMHSIVVANTRRLIELVSKLRPNISTHRLDENLRFGTRKPKIVQEDPLSER